MIVWFSYSIVQENSMVFAHSAEMLDKVNVSPLNEIIPSFGQGPCV
jgi:hypothetical protein